MATPTSGQGVLQFWFSYVVPRAWGESKTYWRDQIFAGLATALIAGPLAWYLGDTLKNQARGIVAAIVSVAMFFTAVFVRNLLRAPWLLSREVVLKLDAAETEIAKIKTDAEVSAAEKSRRQRVAVIIEDFTAAEQKSLFWLLDMGWTLMPIWSASESGRDAANSVRERARDLLESRPNLGHTEYRVKDDVSSAVRYCLDKKFCKPNSA